MTRGQHGRIPHWLVSHHWLPKLVRHHYVTVCPFILCDDDDITPESYAHEYRHLWQQCLAIIVGWLIIWCLPVSRWWLLLPPTHLPYLAVYWALRLVRRGRGGWFERRAKDEGRKQAGRFGP